MSTKSKTKPLFSYSADAPDLLLKKIESLKLTILRAQEAPQINQKAIDFYTDILNTMKYSWSYMLSFEGLQSANQMLVLENEFLKSYAGGLREELNQYQTIETLKLSGDFEAVVARVDALLNLKTDTILPEL